MYSQLDSWLLQFPFIELPGAYVECSVAGNGDVIGTSCGYFGAYQAVLVEPYS